MSFYEIELLTSRPVGILPPILGSIQAWKALDGGRPITLVRSRPDIIAYHLAGESYFSNVAQLDADLAAMRGQAPEPGELRLLEVRHVESGRIPLGIFEPVTGWPLRDVIGFVRCDPPLAAVIALQIYRAYGDAPNLVTPAGALVRQVLPHFAGIWRGEVGSFTGCEPDISIAGRIAEARGILAATSGLRTRGTHDASTPEAGAAFEAELAALADGVDLGRALARTLEVKYGFVSPWGATTRG